MTPEQIEQVAQLHQAELYRYLRFLGADREVAEDLLQETLLGAYVSNPAADLTEWDPGRQAAFLRGIARNQWLRHLRKKTRRREMVDSELTQRAIESTESDWVTHFLQAGDGFQVLEALRSCMKFLSPRQREVIEAFYANNESREKISDRLGMTVDGVKTMLRRVRAGLSDCVKMKSAGAELAGGRT